MINDELWKLTKPYIESKRSALAVIPKMNSLDIGTIFLILGLAIVLLFSSWGSAFADEAIISDVKYTYTVNSYNSPETVTVTGIESDTVQNVTVPASINGKPVTCIGSVDVSPLSLVVSKTITSINLSNCKDLVTFECLAPYNEKGDLRHLNNISFMGCNKLERLTVTRTGISSLTISDCPDLEELQCYNNNISVLSISNCPKLSWLRCFDNPISKLDSTCIVSCSAITDLECMECNIDSIDMSIFPNLVNLTCSYNSIRSLDLSNNLKLSQLDCTNNPYLTNLNLRNNSKLGILMCGSTSISSLDLSNNLNLWELYCPDAKLTSLNISNNSKLKQLNCKNNYISDTASLEAWLQVSGHSGYVLPQKALQTISLDQCILDPISSVIYTGNPLLTSPNFSIKYNGSTLERNRDYTVEVKNNINVGTGSIILTGIGGYTGTKIVTFTILPKSLSGFSISISNQNYTGKALTPAPIVKDGNKVLQLGTDYTVSYSGNTKVGTATATIIGKGNYVGSKAVSFKILGKEEWVKSGNHWLYKNSDGTYVKNCSKVIGGKTYRFDSNGWMKTGWVKEGNYWYYHDASGAMFKGWKKLSGKWYYLYPSDGKMATDFFTEGSNKYYADSSGAMKTGWQKISNKWYYFSGSGAMLKSWQKINGKWYYLNPSDGVMKTGWLDIGASRYYLDSTNGDMKTGWLKINSKWYFFDTKSGAMKKNAWISGLYWVKSDGVMATNEWVDGGRYYVDGNGRWVKNAKPTSGSTNTITNNRDQMTAEELATARQIFDAYNNYRASKNLSKVTWDDTYASWAFDSAKKNVGKNPLQHGLGIPSSQRANHSDILQFATWKMGGSEAVSRWQTSDGHRKMMQCTSVKRAAVGVFKDNNTGYWYYAIVYDFTGSNQGGN